MSQRRAAKRPNYTEEEEELAHSHEHIMQDLTFAILAHEKRGIPAKHTDLKKGIGITSQNEWHNLCHDLKKRFNNVLGMTLINYEASFLAIPHEIPQSSVAHLIEDKSGPKKAFLTTLLTVIFMEENNLPNIPMTETRFEHCLNKLGVSLKGYNPVFGEMSKLVGPQGEFIKNGWIKPVNTHITGEEDPITVYHWGPRALASVDATKILKWHCEVDGSKPEDWERHAKKAKKLRDAMKHHQI